MPRPGFADDKSIFLNSTTVAKIEKSRLEEIRILVLKNNKVDVRVYVFSDDNAEPLPTRKGIWLSAKDLPDIVAALEKLDSGSAAEIKLEIGQSEKIQTRVYTAEFRGRMLVHIRTYYLQNNEFKPGKGVAFSAKLTKQVADGLKSAMGQLKK